MLCLRDVVPLKHALPFQGRPSSPFIDEGEDTGYTREREIREEEDVDGGAHHLLYVGPISPVDDDGDGFMSRPRSSLALYMGVVSWSWRSISS